jgi:type I restriction-modification system DNA methylase subunit
MILKRQVVLKAIVTEKLKESLTHEVEEAIAEVQDAQQQLDVQSRRVMLELQRTDLNRAMAFRQQLESEKRKQDDLKQELQDRLQEYQKLEMGSEFVRGLIEGTVEIREGDNLSDKMGRAEIIVKDDIVIAVREP